MSRREEEIDKFSVTFLLSFIFVMAILVILS